MNVKQMIREIVDSGKTGEDLYEAIHTLVEDYGGDQYWEGHRDGYESAQD